VKLVVTVLCKFLEHKQIQCFQDSLVTNDLTLPAKISALVTLGKVIKPFSIVPTRCFWWMQTISQTERLHSLPTIKVGLFQY
jgi:hypothetical protein